MNTRYVYWSDVPPSQQRTREQWPSSRLPPNAKPCLGATTERDARQFPQMYLRCMAAARYDDDLCGPHARLRFRLPNRGRPTPKDKTHMTNEQIYDEQINPLMAQIIATCKEHGIPMLAHFQLEPYDDVDKPDPLMCSTVLPGNGKGPLMELLQQALLGRVRP